MVFQRSSLLNDPKSTTTHIVLPKYKLASFGCAEVQDATSVL